MEVLLYVFSALLGVCVGSFLNVVIYRLPNGMSLIRPASHCPSCGEKIRWYDNIPLLSWLILRGRCRHCGERISPRYFLVELLCGLLWVCSALKFGFSPMTLVADVALSALLAQVFVDFEHMILLDSLTLTLALCGVAAIFADPSVLWWERLIGGFGGGLLLFGLGFVISKAVKREALGFGDVKLTAAAGLLLGWKNLALGLFLAAVLGVFYLLGKKIAGRYDREEAFPFGPFLAAAFALCLFFGTDLINWYLGLFLG